MPEKSDVEQITLLMDGDTLAFQVASAVQHTQMDEQGFVQPFANILEGEAVLDNMILGLMRDLGAHFCNIYLSDPESNWRRELFPGYKQNRKDVVRPLLLGRLKEYLRSKYGAEHWPGLEADDCLGILATSASKYPGKKIVVGKDKDFNTFPCFVHTIGDRDGKTPIVREITPEYAEWFHLVQTLAGDRVDGYPGCPGTGMERARRFMDDPKILMPERGVITRGLRKGQETVKWISTPALGNVWGAVVSMYEKAGLSEKDALLTARLARILQAEDYDMETGKIRLWTPPERIKMRLS
jgi:5'-3' exonuclease